MHDACGVFGIFAPGRDVARLTFFGLYALQHRGQESAGIAVADEGQVTVVKDMGLVSQVFNEKVLAGLTGTHAIGHVRYSTTGATAWQNSQPLTRSRGEHTIALAHNGNLVNTTELRDELKKLGVDFKSGTDTEVITALIAQHASNDLLGSVREAVSRIRGAFSAAVLTGKKVVGFRDPYGVRPLCLGDFEGNPVIASESCALDIIGAEFVREIEPGEIVWTTGDGELRSERVELPGARPAMCIFEFIYFARPDSRLYGRTLADCRFEMGRHLAMEAPVEADYVIPVPDTGISAAIGYARESGIPYSEGLMKNRYVHRTFIQPDDHLRQLGIRMKLNPIRAVIEGKRLVVVDDSIVRGNTTGKLVDMLYKAGAARCTCASARRPSGSPASTASTWPPATSSSPPARASRRSATTWAPPRCTTSPSTGCRNRPACRATLLPRLLRRRLPHRRARGARHVQDALRGQRRRGLPPVGCRGRQRLRPWPRGRSGAGVEGFRIAAAGPICLRFVRQCAAHSESDLSPSPPALRSCQCRVSEPHPTVRFGPPRFGPCCPPNPSPRPEHRTSRRQHAAHTHATRRGSSPALRWNQPDRSLPPALNEPNALRPRRSNPGGVALLRPTGARTRAQRRPSGI